jgi:hypothetical protein
LQQSNATSSCVKVHSIQGLGEIRPAATMQYVPRLLFDELLVNIDAVAIR